MKNKFIYSPKKSLFEKKLAAGEIGEGSVVFIEDTKEIWNRGHYFGMVGSGSGIDPEVLSGIETAIATLQSDKADKSELSDYALKSELPSLDGYLTKTVADGLYATIAQYNTLSQTVDNVNTDLQTFKNNVALTYATDQDVADAVAALVDSSPAALNTLNELAAALGDNPNFATTVATDIGKKADQTALDATNTNVANVDAKFANYLPKSGGILRDSWSGGTEIRRANRNNGNVMLSFSQQDGTIVGGLGFGGINNPVFVTQVGGQNTLLHAGNIGEYKAGGLAHSNGTIGAVVSSYGTLTIGASDKAGDGSKLYIDNNLRANSIQIGTTYTEGLNRATLALNPNLTTNAVHGVAHVFGADLSTCNAGNIVFRNIGGAGSVKNIVSIGLYGKDDILCCNGNGNVLIGTTTDSGAKLQVEGNTTITGTCSASSGFLETSDERLKDFTRDIEIDFNKLKAIPKKYFTWKNDEEKVLQLGTSAQAVQEVFPELVSGKDTLSVDYSKLVIPALAAIDKLYEENQMLKDRLTCLENKLNG